MQKTQTFLLAILTTIATGFCLYYLKTVLLPFVIALFIVIGCRPILEFVETKLKLHRFLAFIVTFLVGVALLVGFGLLTWYSINDLSNKSAAYEQRLNNIAKWLVTHIPQSVESGSNKTTHQPADENSPTIIDGTTGETEEVDVGEKLEELLQSASLYIQGRLLDVASSLSSLLSYGVLILIFVFFLLLGQDDQNHHRPVILQQVEDKVRQYLVMKTVISAVTGFVFGFVLWLFGVPLAIVFGFLAFMLNFIPNIGPLISTLTPVPFLVLNSEMSPTAAIVCFVLIAAIQFISGNVVETKMMGKSFDVSPVVLLLALMFFGLIWGIIGMFLATPLVSILKIALYHQPETRKIAELMAGRWVGPETSVS